MRHKATAAWTWSQATDFCSDLGKWAWINLNSSNDATLSRQKVESTACHQRKGVYTIHMFAFPKQFAALTQSTIISFVALDIRNVTTEQNMHTLQGGNMKHTRIFIFVRRTWNMNEFKETCSSIRCDVNTPPAPHYGRSQVSICSILTRSTLRCKIEI